VQVKQALHLHYLLLKTTKKISITVFLDYSYELLEGKVLFIGWFFIIL